MKEQRRPVMVGQFDANKKYPERPTHPQLAEHARNITQMLTRHGMAVVADGWDTRVERIPEGWLALFTATYTARTPKYPRDRRVP